MSKSILAFAACALVLETAAAQLVGWKAEGHGITMTLLPETHVGTPIELVPTRRAAIETEYQQARIIAFEDYGRSFRMDAMCHDEQDSSAHLFHPLVRTEFEKWARVAQLDDALKQAFLLTGSDFTRRNVLIDSFSRGALAHNGRPELRSEFSPSNPNKAAAERVLRDGTGREFASLETFDERVHQWCSAPLDARLRILAATFSHSTEWLRYTIKGDRQGLTNFDRAVQEVGQEAFEHALSCARSDHPCKVTGEIQIGVSGLRRLDADRAKALIPQRNLNMARALVEQASRGRLVGVIGAAHFPTLLVEGVEFRGILDLLRDRGLTITELHLCGSTLCERPR